MSVRNYAILYGGKSKSSVATVGGGNAILDTGTHAFVGPEHTGEEITSIPTTETDTTLVLAPDGLGGVAFVAAGTANAELNIEGGQSVIKAHGSMGATETFDPTDGNVHTGTLNADCTFTLNAPTGTGDAMLEFWLTEDGSGGHAVIWPVSVTEVGTHVTTAATTQRVILESVDGGTSWIANWISGGGSTVAALDDLTDVTITTATTADRLRYDGSVWRNSALIWRPMTTYDPTSALWVPLVDGDGNAIMAEA